jgi:hypothetical protein
MKIHPEMLKNLKTYYTPGTRIMLIRMDDPYTNLRRGDKGTVMNVDDIGTIRVQWECGSSIGVVFGKDECKKIEE